MWYFAAILPHLASLYKLHYDIYILKYFYSTLFKISLYFSCYKVICAHTKTFRRYGKVKWPLHWFRKCSLFGAYPSINRLKHPLQELNFYNVLTCTQEPYWIKIFRLCDLLIKHFYPSHYKTYLCTQFLMLDIW